MSTPDAQSRAAAPLWIIAVCLVVLVVGLGVYLVRRHHVAAGSRRPGYPIADQQDPHRLSVIAHALRSPGRSGTE